MTLQEQYETACKYPFRTVYFCKTCGDIVTVVQPVFRIEDKWGGYWQTQTEHGPYNFRTPAV